jgi:hypothetical protein
MKKAENILKYKDLSIEIQHMEHKIKSDTINNMDNWSHLQ